VLWQQRRRLVTKKLNDCIDLIQTCADCTYVNFTSYTYPNGTRTVWEVEGVQNGPSFTYYNCSLTNSIRYLDN